MSKTYNRIYEDPKMQDNIQFNRRKDTFHDAIKFGDTIRIVEIGGIRGEDDSCRNLDGWSTLFWCDRCRIVYSIDINPEATTITKKIAKENRIYNLRAITADGPEWLEKHHEKIDILYLDAGEMEDEGIQEKHLECYQSARHLLDSDSVILIDDTPKGRTKGTGVLVIEAARDDDYQVIAQNYQVLLANPRASRARHLL